MRMISNRFQALLLAGFLGTLVSSSSSSFAQSEKAGRDSMDSKTAKANDRKLPSATALGDIFFQSTNSLIFSLGVQGSTTNNLYFGPAALTGAANRASGYIPFTTISGRMAYQRQLERTTFGLDYGANGLLFRSRDSDDFVSQDGGIHLEYRLTPRAAFTVSDHVSVSPAAGRLFQRDSVLPTFPSEVAPNSTLFVGLNRTVSNTGLTRFSYQLSRRSQLVLGADGTITRFQQRNLSEMNQLGGQVGYSYQVRERTTISFGYDFTYYDFSQSQRLTDTTVAYTGIARSHLGYVGISQQLTPAIGLFIQAGPNYIIGDAQSFLGGFGRRPGVRVSVNGGLTLGQSITLDPRTFFSINAGQSISDGYALGGVTQTQSAGASLGRRLTKTLTGSLHAGYSRNRFLLTLDQRGKPVVTNGISSGANLSLNATQRLSMFANYLYFRQLSNGFLTLIPGRADGNTFTVGLNYSFPIFY